MPELCQMWERREGGNAFAAASRRVGDPHPSPPPFPNPRAATLATGMPPLAPAKRASLAASIPGPVRPPMAAWVGGWRVGCRWLFPPAAFPALASLHPPHCSRPGGREEEQGQGPACGRRPCRRGRQEGKAGKAGVGKRAVGWSRLSCWSSSSSRLPVCPCSSRAAKAGCTPGGRSRSALPWRGSRVSPPPPPILFFYFIFSFSFSQLHLGTAACRAELRPSVPSACLRGSGRASHPSRRGWSLPLPGGGRDEGSVTLAGGPAPRIRILHPVSYWGTFLPCHRVLGCSDWMGQGPLLPSHLVLGSHRHPGAPHSCLPLHAVLCHPGWDGRGHVATAPALSPFSSRSRGGGFPAGWRSSPGTFALCPGGSG